MAGDELSYCQDSWPISSVLAAALCQLHNQIFEGKLSPDFLAERLGLQRQVLIQTAWQGEQLVGYKIGYERKQGSYYSWIGGVAPSLRRQGIAWALMEQQHRWCAQHGYRAVRTLTQNRWRQMLVLNLKQGFDIIGMYTDEQGESKLILEKKLTASTGGV